MVATYSAAAEADRRAIDLHQRLALGHPGAGGDVGHLLHPAFGPHRDDRDAALVELNGARRADGGADDPRLRGLRFHAGALNFSRRQLHRSVVAVFALVDGDVIHPHRILLRDRRGIGEPHRIAVEFDLAVRRRDRRGSRGRFIFEAEVRAGRHGAIVPAVRGLLRRQRVERAPVRILIIDRYLRCSAPTPAKPAPLRRSNEGGRGRP